ncbi:MAG: NosD domain-containing protein [Candidatus Woesearchaeota archaeon]
MNYRVFALIAVLILMSPAVFAASRTCTRTIDPPRIYQNTILCSDNYYPHNYPQGINITNDNIVLDCGTSVLHGQFANAGIVITNRKNITVKNCQVANYNTGILIKNSEEITILNSNMIRNIIGIKLVNSRGIVVENSHDISLTKPIQLINSSGNTFHYINKKIGDDNCRLNQCNTPTGMAAKEAERAKSSAAEKALSRKLRDNLRAWIYPGSSVFSRA